MIFFGYSDVLYVYKITNTDYWSKWEVTHSISGLCKIFPFTTTRIPTVEPKYPHIKILQKSLSRG